MEFFLDFFMCAPPFTDLDLGPIFEEFTEAPLDAIGPFGAGAPLVVVLGPPLFGILDTRFIYILSLYNIFIKT
jgi:hypothetical protein